MRSIYWVIRKEFLERVRKKSFIIMTILTPLLFVAIMIIPALMVGLGSEKIHKIAIVDKTGWAGDSLIKKLKEKPEKKSKKGISMEEQSNEKMRGNVLLEAYLVAKGKLEDHYNDIESGIIDGILLIEYDPNNNLSATYSAKNISNISLTAVLEGAMRDIQIDHTLNERGVDPSISSILKQRVYINAVKIEKGKGVKGSFMEEYLKGIVMVMILYMLIMMYGMALMRGVMEEKQSRVIDVLLSSIKPFNLLMGKVIGIGLVGLLQYAIWFTLIFSFIFSNPMNIAKSSSAFILKPSQVALMIIYYLIGFIMYSSIYAAVGAICTTDQEAQQFQTPISLFLAVPFFMAPYLIQNPDTTLATVLSLIPLFTPTLMLMRASIIPIPFWQIGLSIILMLLMTVILVWTGSKIYRMGLLMTGKRPTIPELFKWLKRT